MSRKLLLNNVKQQIEPDKFLWIGYIQYDETGENGWMSFDDGSEFGTFCFEERYLDIAVNAGTVIQFIEEEFPGSFQIHLDGWGEYFFAVIPEGYDLMIDNGVGTPTPINSANGEIPFDGEPIKELIGDVQYYLYGFMASSSGNRTFYLYAN